MALSRAALLSRNGEDGMMDGSFALGRIAALAVAAAALCGCDRLRTPSGYETLTGAVVTVPSELGEIVVRVRLGDGLGERLLVCALTKDAETYVNDRFASPQELRAGDVIDLVGYRDPNPQLERFVISFAHVRREMVRAPPPLGDGG